MADVKWIKITTSMFDDEKIKIIESMPEADTLLIIWIKILVLAGKTNADGYIYLSENIPYTDEMLSTLFGRSLNVIRMALKVFMQFGMLKMNEQGALYVLNWDKHQNITGLDKIREQNRLRKQKQREKEKLLMAPAKEELCITDDGHVMSRDSHAIEEEREEEVDIDKEEEKNTKTSTPFKEIKDLYNTICKSLPSIRQLSKSRKEHIKARWKQFDNDIKSFEEAFNKLENSNFCKGNNDRNWKADFDWIIKNDNNMVKVLEGKYDNPKKNTNAETNKQNTINHKTKFHNFKQTTSKYSADELEEKLRRNLEMKLQNKGGIVNE